MLFVIEGEGPSSSSLQPSNCLWLGVELASPRLCGIICNVWRFSIVWWQHRHRSSIHHSIVVYDCSKGDIINVMAVYGQMQAMWWHCAGRCRWATIRGLYRIDMRGPRGFGLHFMWGPLRFVRNGPAFFPVMADWGPNGSLLSGYEQTGFHSKPTTSDFVF